MRFAEFKLLEAKQQLFAIGDSHAAAIGSQAGWNNLAKNSRRAEDPANDAAIAKVPNGSLVVLSAGANNMLDPNKTAVVGRIESLINKLKQKQCTVYYVLFASTDHPKFANDRNQLREMVKNAVGSDVGILDMGSLKYKPGTSDGIHAPMGWYIQAARTAASGAKEVASRAGQGAMPDTTKPEQNEKPNTGSTAFSIEVPDVSLGWKGAGIMDVQKALVALGYDVGPQGTDGIRGKNTIAAVKKYQADRNLNVDGDPGPETVAALNKDIQSNPDKFKSVTKSNPSDIKQSSRVGQEYSPQPVAYDAVTTGRVGEVLNFVAAPESRGYYDMMFGGKRKAEILKMTIEDANRFQNAWGKQAGSSAMGRYQIMHFNTISYARKAGLDPKKDLFNPENQDKMGVIFLKEKGLDRWLAGKLDDKAFLENLAKVWAGLPAPSKGGNSYYGGVGLNRDKTQVSMNTALNTLQDIKSA